MDNHEKEMNEQDSLRIIQQMIDTAKSEQKDDGIGWIVWGWLLFLTSVFSILNILFHWFFDAYFFWNVFGLITALYGCYKVFTSFYKKTTNKVKTYTKEIFDKLNAGFFISLMFIIIAINVGVISPATGFTLLMNLYGFWILIYGTVLNFKPSIIGAYITWALAFTGLFFNRFEMVMALHAGAALIGYIIPGHIANKRFNDTKERTTIQSGKSV